ncbi:hypothetical protein ETAA8_02700 [Anatilimnocola aggregata]|uniref:DUF1501 domain-containing protein n=1 Tax=Anatilimnocola aggregata TaxID=2528021 RepID=A0A517Y4P8_9BACT|nr:DUF1501 domain-containing protein [Anatilimnocola aggregata]QDU25207.1 hypothetical protein ETAA8_02700 [Anatilimnocola aggregata]
MLTIADPRPSRNCQGLARRDFLKIGALGSMGFGGLLTLPQLLAAKAAGSPLVRDKSVVLLFLSGGPSHIEFFDPKMSAPAEIRSVTGELQTKHPGITFGGTFPQLAERADKFTVVRSYGSGNSGHSYESVTTGGNTLKSALGAIYARVAGVNHPQTGIPNNILLLPEAVKEGLKLGSNFETGALPTLTQPGDLGPSFNAFNPAGGGQLKDNLELKIPAERLLDRRNLLAGLDRMKRDAEREIAVKGADEFQQQALDVITRGVAQAFDLKQESQATLERYDTSKVFRNEDVQRWGDMRRSTNLLGRQMLLARRLCEAGCGFVTVSDCGWDMHSNGNSPKFLGGMQPLGHQVDHAVSAFIDDVRERGLQEKILLVVTGEMGRTPRINNNGGRDHYGDLTPLLLFGGGLKMGQVIGQSDGQAARAAGKSYRPQNLLITLMNVLFDMGLLRLQTNIPRDVAKLGETAEPIDGLL